MSWHVGTCYFVEWRVVFIYAIGLGQSMSCFLYKLWIELGEQSYVVLGGIFREPFMSNNPHEKYTIIYKYVQNTLVCIQNTSIYVQNTLIHVQNPYIYVY